MLVHPERLDVEDVVSLEERGVGLDALPAECLELAPVLDEAARSVEVEESRRRIAHVPERVDDSGGREDERAGGCADDLVSGPELDLALEDVERVAVAAMEVRGDLAPRSELELDERELGPRRLDDAVSELLSLAGAEDDRVVHSGSEPHDERCPGAVAVLGRIELIEAGVAAAKVVAEPGRRSVDVEAACARPAVVVEPVDDVGREHEQRSGRERERAVGECERELSVDDEEAVGVRVMDVRLGSALACAVVELGDDELVGVDQDGGASPRPRSDRLSVVAARPRDDDELGIGRHHVRRRPLVERGDVAANVLAIAGPGSVEDEEPRRRVTGHLDVVYDLGRDERPGLRADAVYAVLERKRELSFEDVQRLAVSGVGMGRRLPPPGSCAHVGDGELLDVDEERDVELSGSQDDFAFRDFDHVPAA